MRLRLSAALLATAPAGCAAAPEPGVYEVPVAEAYRRLARSEMPELRFARQCGILIHIRPESIPNRSVTWRVYSSGREMVRFTATLTALDAGRTRAEVSIGQKNGREAYDGSQTYPRPAFNQPLRPAVEEQVAALLEGREYDAARVPRGTDSVCNVQRAGLEHGHRFSIHDEPGMDSRMSASARRDRARGW